MARQFLTVVQESALGVAVASPVVGTSSSVIRLDGGNAFDARMKPVIWNIAAAGGRASVNALTGADQYATAGKLASQFYASQAAMLLGWGIAPINAGQTVPWTTTEEPGDLASMSVYHAFFYPGTVNAKRQRYAGMKVAGGRIEVSRDSPVAKLSLDLIGQKAIGNAVDSSSDPDSSEFPTPAEASYPIDPYVFSHVAGGLTIGSARTMFESVSIEWKNVIDAKAYEAKFPQVINFLGREVTLVAKLRLKATPDDRADFATRAAKSVSLAFANGVHTTTFNLFGQCHYDDLVDDLDDAKNYSRTLTVKAYWDPTANSGAGESFGFTFA